jgi:hypothetical protein
MAATAGGKDRRPSRTTRNLHCGYNFLSVSVSRDALRLETQGCWIGLTTGEHPARDLVPPIVPLVRHASLT